MEYHEIGSYVGVTLYPHQLKSFLQCLSQKNKKSWLSVELNQDHYSLMCLFKFWMFSFFQFNEANTFKFVLKKIWCTCIIFLVHLNGKSQAHQYNQRKKLVWSPAKFFFSNWCHHFKPFGFLCNRMWWHDIFWLISLSSVRWCCTVQPLDV